MSVLKTLNKSREVAAKLRSEESCEFNVSCIKLVDDIELTTTLIRIFERGSKTRGVAK